MDLFLDLFNQKLFANLGFAVVAVSLALVRILAFLHFAPVFSHKSVPSTFRIGMAILLTSVVALHVQTEPQPIGGYSLVYAVLVNFALGFVMGFTTNVIFMITVVGGEMMDSSMGFSAAQTFDPSHGGQTTLMGKFMGMLATVIFFTVSGPEMLIEGICHSFETFSIYAPNLTISIPKIISLCGDVIRMAFVITSPIIITILVNDIVLGLLSRAAPQINAFQISFTIKPVIGLLIWLLVLPQFFRGIMTLFSTVDKLF